MQCGKKCSCVSELPLLVSSLRKDRESLCLLWETGVGCQEFIYGSKDAPGVPPFWQCHLLCKGESSLSK